MPLSTDLAKWGGKKYIIFKFTFKTLSCSSLAGLVLIPAANQSTGPGRHCYHRYVTEVVSTL